MSQIDEKINTNKQRVKAVDRKSVFEDPDAKQELDCLQNDFIIVPIDKASSNIAFICRRRYAEVIYNELDISSAQNPNSTYGITNTSSADIILSHRTEMSDWDLELLLLLLLLLLLPFLLATVINVYIYSWSSE